MKILEATDEMVQVAENDVPIIGNMPYEKMTYPVGMLIRAEEEENIVKIGFFFTEILAAGGRRPLYTLFIDKKKDCFIGYDYRLKSWTNKMLDKIEYPNGVKKHHAWCDLKSLEIIRKTVEENCKENEIYDSIWEFEEQVRRRTRITKNRKITREWDKVMNCVKETPKDWDKWMKKVGITENYIFYQYSKKKKADTGYCTWCERNVPIKDPKYNKKGICPNCSHKIHTTNWKTENG